ncbi:MAG: hypothetical protein M3Q10_08465 [Chloroflexota bacterium]|nr:hypothetical protein [Chloroflexota bacterium]
MTPSEGLPAPAPPLTAADLGFAERARAGWRKRVGDRDVLFRPLRRLSDLLPVEALQRAVFGVTDRDLLPASALVVVPETGGEVLGAFGGEGTSSGEELLGFALGWGGFRDGRPRLVSDMLGVRADRRHAGLGAELKRLQALRALERGFPEVVWTVDPLRAANARLNIEKLGAVADRYEEDRYGAGYGAGLYGGLSTDRLHVTWHLTSPRVRDRLLGRARPTDPADVADLPRFAPGLAVPRALVPLPADVDRLLADDPSGVLQWRLALRSDLTAAFGAGFAVTGFAADRERQQAWYVIERRSAV